MSDLLNEITVDANGEWCGAFEQDQYLVSDELQAALNNGLKAWNIERDYEEGKDWVLRKLGDPTESSP